MNVATVVAAVCLSLHAGLATAQTSNKKKTANTQTRAVVPASTKPIAPIATPPAVVTTPDNNMVAAQTDASPQYSYYNTNILLDKIAGKFLIKAEGGYLYQFASSWSVNGESLSRPLNPLWLGVGGSVAYEHMSGWGLSADYFGIYNFWPSTYSRVDNPLFDNRSYSEFLHIISLSPTYRLSFGLSRYFGLKFGLGVGMSLSTLTVTHNAIAHENLNGTYGIFLTPLLGFEFDNGVMHFDINSKFIYSFVDIGYGGTQRYTNRSRAVAAYGGLGLGLNF